MASQHDGLTAHLRPVQAGEEHDDGDLWEAVDAASDHIHALVSGHDAFDVMSVLAQYLLPPDLALWSESGSSTEDAWSSAEIVALVLLGLGLPGRAPEVTWQTAAVVPELLSAASVVHELAAIRGLVRLSQVTGEKRTSEALSAMSFHLSGHETLVRGRQYTAIAERINDAVLRTALTDRVFLNELGFTYDDVLATRSTLFEILRCRHGQARDAFERALEATAGADAEALVAIRTILETPGQLWLITHDDVSELAPELPSGVAKSVLDYFSVAPDGRSPRELVREFVSGHLPMSGLAILRDPERGYLPMPGAIALDEIRRTCEAAIKGTRSWTSYGRARDKAVEALVVDAFAAFAQDHGTAYRNLKYREPQLGHDLSRSSTEFAVAPVAEADCLLVSDGVAICIEVKAGDLRTRSRQGGLAQLEGDLRKTVQDADVQAGRLRSLIVEHHGVWQQDGEWLDLSGVDEVHSIVVCLDDLGPLALSTSEMVHAGILDETHLPWVVSVHDLLVVLDVLHRPEHFLTYLRRRTSRDAAMWITGSDELDILMWFVSGGFYFIPDPDRIHHDHPGSKPPTARMRRRYAEQGLTVVGTLTDPLDAYYYWLDGSSSHPTTCPRRRDLPPVLLRVVETMRENKAPGWWRSGADLDGYSQSSLDALALSVSETLSRTKSDGGFHTCANGGSDGDGRWLHIFAAGADNQGNRNRLRQYVIAKKHQNHADRSLAVLLDTDGNPQFTIWLSYPQREDAELDRLARSMGLVPDALAPSVLPPRARLRARRRKRKQPKVRRRK